MKRLRWPAVFSLLAILAAGAEGRAQKDPHLGYVYPAGGQRGTEFHATVGGQFLGGANEAYISGDGVRAQVVHYTKPLTQKEANALRQKLREFGRRLQAQRKKSGGRRKRDEPETIERIARDVGLEVTDAKSIAALRSKLSRSRQQLNPQLAEKVLLRLEIESDASPGERELRLKSEKGVSNPIRFHVGEWPEHRETEPNQKVAESVSAAERPIIINGQISPGDLDRFRFEAREGERLVVAASARRLIPFLADAVPGWFQATLSLRDASGEEVAFADDYRFHPDPVLFYEVPSDGSYVLEIRDAIYRGREDFVYRIALGELPFVTSIFPLGGRAGEKLSVNLKGWNLPRRQLTFAVEDSTVEDCAVGIREISIGDGELLPRHFPFAVDTWPECREEEPNDRAPSAQAVQLPQIINGRIARPGDRDLFRFEGKPGEEIVVEVEARQLDSPLDSLLELTDASGRLLKANDDHENKGAGLTTHHADSRLHFEIPAKGEFVLRLSDTQHKGGDAYAYRLRIGPRRPDFALRVVPSSVNVRAGATVPITVHALRKDGFSEDIALGLRGAPDGFRLSGAWVPAGRDRVELTLSVAPGTPVDLVPLRLEGLANVDGRELRRQAVPAEDRMQAFIYRHLVPAKEWLVAVSQQRRWRTEIGLVDDRPVELSVGGTTRVRVSAARAALFRQIRLELHDPPEGIALRRVIPDDDGAVLVFGVTRGKVRPGLKGNLIVRVFSRGKANARKPPSGRKSRRVLLGTLPAIAFDVVADRGPDGQGGENDDSTRDAH